MSEQNRIQNKNTSKLVDYNISRNELILFIVLIGIIIIVLPLTLTNSIISIKDFNSTGQIGDTIGGITAPFLSIIGSVLVYIAFKEQVRANKLIQDQFKVQQFESQFIEMLRTYTVHVEAMRFNDFNGFEVFVEANGQIRRFLDATHPHYYIKTSNYKFRDESDIELFKAKFKHCYNVFFWGNSSSTLELDDLSIHFTEPILQNIHIWNNTLGHYFRHLFHLMRFIFESNSIHENDKYNYFKRVRTQMSNQEQLLLFYNWCANYGQGWENEENNFFTKFKMIHNLPIGDIYNHPFFNEKLDYLRKKALEFGIETLFEYEE